MKERRTTTRPRALYRMGASLACPALGLLMLVGVPVVEARAQADPPPFSSFTISVHGGKDVGSDGLRDYWTLGAVRGLDVATPFHFGSELALFALAVPYASRSPGRPDFSSWLAGAEWLYPVVRGPVRLSVGVAAGDFLNSFPGFHESEFFAGGTVRIAVPVHRRFELFARGSRTHVFTRRPISHTVLTAGGSASLATPAWLRPLFE
jgi:hypothetical protein